MSITENAPELSRALANAAGHPVPAPHLTAAVTLWLTVAGLAVLCCLVYRISLWLHPFTMCRRCGGSGHVTGFLPWSRAFCYRCGGRGLVPRVGTHITGLRERRPR